MTTIFKISLLLFAVSAVSCVKVDCANTNSILDAHLPGTKPYNDELLHLIDKNVSYYFLKYEEKDGMEYIHVDVEGDSICATAVMTIINPVEELAELQKAKGIGYTGAELENLQFNVYKDSTKTELILESIAKILD